MLFLHCFYQCKTAFVNLIKQIIVLFTINKILLIKLSDSCIWSEHAKNTWMNADSYKDKERNRQ